MFLLSTAVIAAAVVVFSLTRVLANPQRPRTMTKEWQEASEEYLKVRTFTTITQAQLIPIVPANNNILYRHKEVSLLLGTRVCLFKANLDLRISLKTTSRVVQK